MTRDRLRIAIQKKGRLAEGSLSLLTRSGLNIQRREHEELLQRVKNFPIDILRVRDDDIAAFVADGACELGIVGRNVLAEEGYDDGSDDIEILSSLNMGRCSLKIAVPENWSGESLSDLSGKRIATSYPRLLRRFLYQHGVEATIVEMRGSVEVAPRLQLATAICDLVSTGATLEANGLKPLETVFDSEAVLIRAKKPLPDALEDVASRLQRRIDSVVVTDGTKYIMLNAPRDALEQITDLLPGAGSPTVIPLSNSDQVAVHAVCQESVFWGTLEKLKSAGASAILVVPIEKMML
jgi:ATP phosphoribosyltransferase